MRTTKPQVMLLVAALFFSNAAAAAATEQALASYLEAFRVTRAQDGSESLAPVNEIAPGEIIEYRLIYENRSSGPLSALVVSIPVPQYTEYLANTAGANVDFRLEASIDRGVSHAPEPLMRRASDGQMQLVPASEYSNLRWVSADVLSPGEVQTYTYRVVVAQ